MSIIDPPLEAILLRWPYGHGWGDAVWRMLVGSMLRLGATREELDEVWPEFFAGWPTPEVCRNGTPSADAQIALLGDLHRRREKVSTIRRLARVWEQRQPPRAAITSLPGCRAREREAYELFAEHGIEIERLDLQDPDLACWLDLRLSQGWNFDAESEIVNETLERMGLVNDSRGERGS